MQVGGGKPTQADKATSKAKGSPDRFTGEPSRPPAPPAASTARNESLAVRFLRILVMAALLTGLVYAGYLGVTTLDKEVKKDSFRDVRSIVIRAGDAQQAYYKETGRYTESVLALNRIDKTLRESTHYNRGSSWLLTMHTTDDRQRVRLHVKDDYTQYDKNGSPRENLPTATLILEKGRFKAVAKTCQARQPSECRNGRW